MIFTLHANHGLHCISVTEMNDELLMRMMIKQPYSYALKNQGVNMIKTALFQGSEG